MLAGLALLGVLALALAAATPRAAGFAACVGAVLFLHFGAFSLLAAAWHRSGRSVRPLMDAPLLAPSLGEFWGRRWNTAFAALAHRFVLDPLRPRLGSASATMAVFLASGLVHDLVLTVPVGGGWGGPTLYFLIQGGAVLLERSRVAGSLGLGDGSVGARVFVLALAILPLPLLLPSPVLLRLGVPMAEALSLGDPAMSVDSLLGLALWLAVLAHASVLLAGVQMPRRLNWHEELRRLSRFNRRIVWVYHAFIGLLIVFFAGLTAALHDEMLRGERAAVGLALMIGTFWAARLVVDLVVYRHDDWPKGRAVAVGHGLLVFAFAAMSVTYLAVVGRSVMGT
jgi:alginate O-acetyltransferase complex protein AlgI